MRIKKLNGHHSEMSTTNEDREVGCELSKTIGDTLVDFKGMAPCAQWAVIAKALRVHGLKIAERRKGRS